MHVKNSKQPFKNSNFSGLMMCVLDLNAVTLAVKFDVRWKFDVTLRFDVR